MPCGFLSKIRLKIDIMCKRSWCNKLITLKRLQTRVSSQESHQESENKRMCVKALSCSDKLVIVAGWGFLCSNRAINLCLLLGIPSPTILYFIVHEGIVFFHYTTLPSSTQALPKKPKPTSFKDLLNSKTSTKPHKSQTKWSPFNFNNWYFCQTCKILWYGLSM